MRLLLLPATLFFCLQVFAADKDSVFRYSLPDSVNAVSLIADVKLQSVGKKEISVGIGVKGVSLVLEADKKEKEVSFRFPASATIVATGVGVEREKGELEWEYNLALQTVYKLLIASAADSAENFVLYSGYIFLPAENKWKLIGTCRIEADRNIKEPSAVFSWKKNNRADAAVSNVWTQRSNGSWKQLTAESSDIRPVLNPMPNVDSVRQYQLDQEIIQKAISSGASDATGIIDGVYYKIIDPGNGKTFTVADSVTVKYQLRIFGTETVISGNETDVYTFPLRGLIKAWQVAVPLVKTGGKIKLVIPSGLAYSIRTRAPKIPPNSILEFQIEVLDAKLSAR